MITAKEARSTVEANKLVDYHIMMTRIEDEISEAVDKKKMYICIDFVVDAEVRIIIVEELKQLGYEVQYHSSQKDGSLLNIKW